MLDRSASVFCFTPLRVPVSELGRLATGQTHVFGFVSRIIASSRLFGSAASPKPLSGVPTPGAGVRAVASSRLLEGHAPPGSRT